MRTLIVLALVLIAGGAIAADETPAPWVWRASASFSVDFADGRNLGTVFEATDSEGAVVAGAGFLGLYNTYTRADPRTLYFFAKPPGAGSAAAIEPLPRPTESTVHYLLDEAGAAYAYDRTGRYGVRRWQDGAWLKVERASTPAMRVGPYELRFSGGQVTVNGTERMAFDPAIGGVGSFYYGQGVLFFHLSYADSPENETALYAVPWRPADGPVDLGRAVVLPLSVPREFPYSYGQHGDSVIVGTNNGGVHRFRDGTWQTLREADPKVSFQLYTMMNYYDRLLMGQYPTGELFEIAGDEVVRIEGWPPRPDNASSGAREAQTLMIYRGALYVGVWPWGEVWRLPAPDASWEFAGRLFTEPAITLDVQAPYVNEMEALGEPVHNLWGQRVTGMAAAGGSLLFTTANKGGTPFDARFTFLDDVSRREYGAAYTMTLPGHLSAVVQPKAGTSYFEFRITPEAMTITQDGVEIGALALDPAAMAEFRAGRVQWGAGMYGTMKDGPQNYAVDTPEAWIP